MEPGVRQEFAGKVATVDGSGNAVDKASMAALLSAVFVAVAIDPDFKVNGAFDNLPLQLRGELRTYLASVSGEVDVEVLTATGVEAVARMDFVANNVGVCGAWGRVGSRQPRVRISNWAGSKFFGLWKIRSSRFGTRNRQLPGACGKLAACPKKYDFRCGISSASSARTVIEILLRNQRHGFFLRLRDDHRWTIRRLQSHHPHR